MDEFGLIQSARQGDLEAFNRLVLHYQDMVFAQAYRLVGDEDSAADIAQETFISAYKNLGAYRGGSFRAWLLRITTNAAYDELRRRKRKPVTALEPLDTEAEEIESPRWLADGGESPEERLERAELEKAIQHCLETLPGEFRAVVVLVDVQGFDYAEAAEVIRKPVGTVKSRLARARMRLRECLQGLWELLPARFRLINESVL